MHERKGLIPMNTTTREYRYLFNRMSDLAEELQRLQMEIVRAQMESEELFLDEESDLVPAGVVEKRCYENVGSPC